MVCQMDLTQVIFPYLKIISANFQKVEDHLIFVRYLGVIVIYIDFQNWPHLAYFSGIFLKFFGEVEGEEGVATI